FPLYQCCRGWRLQCLSLDRRYGSRLEVCALSICASGGCRTVWMAGREETPGSRVGIGLYQSRRLTEIAGGRVSVLILLVCADVSLSIGTGHVIRCFALA